MKKLIYLLCALLVSIDVSAQEVVFSSGDFTIEDAMKMIENGYSATSALGTYNTYEGYVIDSRGTINGHNLGSLENVLILFENCKNKVSTSEYTISKAPFGSVSIVFKGETKEYTVTPYLRKLVVKTIKKYLKNQ
tara:strand:- start:539 stop:943 length:405 start_codon:yes stop_codon:yes gene_type:complete